jgi:hypothetical protein
MDKIIFQTFYDKGRKYARIGKEKILMELSTEDNIKNLCKKHFKKFRIQFYKAEKPIFMLFVPKDVDTSLFTKRMNQLYGNDLFWDISKSL